MKKTSENKKVKYNIPDYRKCNIKNKEYLFMIILASIFIFIGTYIFYRSTFISFFTMFIGILYPKLMKKRIILKQQNQLKFQFRELLYSIITSISSGKSLEKAFYDADKDLKIIFIDSNIPIIYELERIKMGLENNKSIEDLLEDLAIRSGVEEISRFSEMIAICKRSGGNLQEAVRSNARLISEKIEVYEEIQTMVVGKKTEHTILAIFPVVIIFITSITSKEYMDYIYTTEIGKLVSTITIMILALGYYWGKRIMDIRV